MTDRIYYRKKDLTDQLDMARGTVSDWLTEYAPFIPIEKHGNVTYYLPDSIKVLKAIKEIKEDGYLFKHEIVPQLLKRGFAVNAEEEQEDFTKAIEPDEAPRDGIIAVINELHKQGKSVEALQQLSELFALRIEEQVKRTDGYDSLISTIQLTQEETAATIKQKQDNTDKKLESMEKTIENLSEKLKEAEREIELAKERSKQSFWKRMFGG